MTSEPPKTSLASRSPATEKILFRALIAVVALAPLPLASNRPLPAAILAAFMGALLIAWAAYIGFGVGKMAVSPRKLRWPLLLFGLCAIWILLQSLPIVPAGLVDPIWHEASRALGEPLHGTISVDPNATRTALMRLLSYAAAFWLSLQLCRQPDRARQALVAVVYIGAAYAIYGIIVYALGNQQVLYFHKWAYQAALSSTFVNRNSYAAFAGLCLLCASVYFINSFSHFLTTNRRPGQKAVLIIETIFQRAILRTIAVMSLMTALILTGSRAGTASSLVALFVLMLTFARKRSFQLRHALVAAALLGGLLLIIMAASGNLLFDRLAKDGSDLSAADRSMVYATTMDAIETAPWTGTGYGTYRSVFTAYRPETLSSKFFWDKAHNDYLENALELGIPAAIMLNLSVLLLAIEAARGLRRRRRNRTLPAIGVAATVLVGLHSLLDFSLQIPAISILYAFLMGMAVSQAWPPATQGQGR